MTLLTAHKILITTAVVFFLGFSLWQFQAYRNTDDAWAAAQAVFYLVVAAGLAVYLARLKSWVK